VVQAHWVFLCAGVAAPLRGVLVSGELPGLASVVIVVAAAVGAEIAEVLEDFGIEDGGADFIDAGGPFAEVDFAAAITAEGEVFAVVGDELAAGGAAEDFGGLFLGSHGFLARTEGPQPTPILTRMDYRTDRTMDVAVGWPESERGDNLC